MGAGGGGTGMRALFFPQPVSAIAIHDKPAQKIPRANRRIRYHRTVSLNLRRLFCHKMVVVKITRRQFETMAAATALVSTVRKARGAAPTTYTGPLDGFEDKVKMEDFDP